MFENCVLFTECVSNISNSQVDNAKDRDAVMPMYNLIQYIGNDSKTSGSLWQYYRDEPNVNITESKLLKFKIKITRKTPDNDNK